MMTLIKRKGEISRHLVYEHASERNRVLQNEEKKNMSLHSVGGATKCQNTTKNTEYQLNNVGQLKGNKLQR